MMIGWDAEADNMGNYQEFVVEGAELRQYKHKFLKRLDMYHELKFDEKEQHNSEKENEQYLKELQEKL